MTNIYMYDYGDNKRKAKIRNTSMLVDLSFGAAHKKQKKSENPQYVNACRPFIWSCS